MKNNEHKRDHSVKQMAHYRREIDDSTSDLDFSFSIMMKFAFFKFLNEVQNHSKVAVHDSVNQNRNGIYKVLFV